jgi:uncharacterized membrane protein
MSLLTYSVGIYSQEQHHDTLRVSDIDNLIQMATEEYHKMETINGYPNYHSLIVHFPFVLVLIAVVFQMQSLFYHKREFDLATMIILPMGVIVVWLVSDIFHSHQDFLKGRKIEIFETYEQTVILILWFSYVVMLLERKGNFWLQKKWLIARMESVVTLFPIAPVINVSFVGYHGDLHVHNEGIGSMLKGLKSREHLKNDPSNTLITDTSGSYLPLI